MERFPLSALLRATGGQLAGPVDGDPWIEAVTIDGRQVPPGALFVPVRGKRYDAHDFVEQAFLNGAAFSLAARDSEVPRRPANTILVKDTTVALGDLARWYRSRFDVPVVGVTGSCGKTTVKEMIRLVLGEDVVASHASFNNQIGVPLTLLRMDRHTRACVVEIGTNAPGEIAYLTSIARPTVGVLTNVEEAHLEGLGSVRGVMAEKRALLDGLGEQGAAIVNADNYWCREVMEHLRCHKIAFGTWEDADVFGTEGHATASGVEFLLMGRMPIELPVMGVHNVSNALAAIAVGMWLDRKPLQIRDALAAFRAPPMRMSREIVGDVVLINDAYNANPRSMEAAIAELAARPVPGRRVAVLGEMLELGGETERHHRALGKKVASANIDLLWTVGPSGAAVAEEARRHGMPASAVVAHESMDSALATPPFEPRSGDTWLFKGSRGLALERLVERVRGLVDPTWSDGSASRALPLGRLDETRP